MDYDVVCNFRKCRKRLTGYAWVTSCSHIFCNEDGTKQFEKTHKCPACDTELACKFDIIRIDLNPSEQYKSMVLAGQRPEVILDACCRAMSFWTYQTHQELIYQQYIATKHKERCSQLEQINDHSISKAQCDISSLKQQLESMKKEIEFQKQKTFQLVEKLSEKDRQYKKLQAMYDMLRKRCVTPSLFERSNKAEFRHERSFGMPLTTADEILHPAVASHGDRIISAEDFVLAPVVRGNHI